MAERTKRQAGQGVRVAQFRCMVPPSFGFVIVGTLGGAVSGQGSAGNVISALASFFIPGLGQLLQGRFMIAIVMFVLAGVLWFFELGRLGLIGGHVTETMPMVRSPLALIPHLWSGIDAALWKRKS